MSNGRALRTAAAVDARLTVAEPPNATGHWQCYGRNAGRSPDASWPLPWPVNLRFIRMAISMWPALDFTRFVDSYDPLTRAA